MCIRDRSRNNCKTCKACSDGLDQCCTGVDAYEKSFSAPNQFGALATHYQGNAEHCYPIPKELNLEKGAALICAGVTVFAPLNRHKKLELSVLSLELVDQAIWQYNMQSILEWKLQLQIQDLRIIQSIKCQQNNQVLQKY
eukprot:TRINITY_DN1976_c0_g1_i1.p2 TRINITY_DN1976_c0_g1~~TRINITY_DN1976_c0_g1_i1.p2  ORF type:complete len:161 (+),score=49.60 TRINITY_DN1976_c0_g1_i1:64-483(+)